MKALRRGVLSVLLQGLDSLFFEMGRLVPSSAERFCAGARLSKSVHQTQAMAMTFGFAHRLGQTSLAANSGPFMKYPG
jgi:hypothetical protein